MNARRPTWKDALARRCERIGRDIRIMEVCGTHTVAAFRSGIRSLLPRSLRLISGPGCPVCVTAQRHIDAAIELATIPNVIVATYGDMLRVPGRLGSLERRRAAGADVRVVASAMRAVEIARRNPEFNVVFLGVGFETTAPATAIAILQAECEALSNFSVLVSHKRVIPAMAALLASGDVPIDGFLCPGHVSVIIGADAYRPIAAHFAKPCVVAGFEPNAILRALLHLARQIDRGIARVENLYPEVVSIEGNSQAQALLQQVFTVADAPWRELGTIPSSGFELARRYRRFDALRRFNIAIGDDDDHPACRCGDVILGRLDPPACALFGNGCTPLSPIGPCMVSSEGTCSAWFKYNGHAARSGAAS